MNPKMASTDVNCESVENIFEKNRKCDYCFRYIICNYEIERVSAILDETVITEQGLLFDICKNCCKNIFENKIECIDCHRYIFEDHHMRWAEAIFDDGYMTKKGHLSKMCSDCENDLKKEAIFRNKQCKQCGLYFLNDEQDKWNLFKIFNDYSFYNYVTSFTGTLDEICAFCETIMSADDYIFYKYDERQSRSKKRNE